MKHVDVVIISWAKDDALLQVTKNGLDSLFESESDIAFHAYVVESNKNVNYDEYNSDPRYPFHSVQTIHTDLPFGYHRYLNLGRKAGNSTYVVLCNSDLTYEKNWASSIIEAMEDYPQFLSASPWCPQTQGNNEPHMNQIYQGHRVRGELAGWCIFQQRSIYDRIGELDEQFEFWFCDNDYSFQLQLNQIAHCLIPNSVVNHHDKNLGKTGETLSETEQKRITEDQQSVFMNKYGKLLQK
jgi:GT2 family glycosyltransferase